MSTSDGHRDVVGLRFDMAGDLMPRLDSSGKLLDEGLFVVNTHSADHQSSAASAAFTGSHGIAGLHGVGNAETNSIVGTMADDTLDGAGGVDYLTGGFGADRFVLRSLGIGSRADRITDFNSAQGDRLVIPASLFGDDQVLDVGTISSWAGLQGALRTSSDLIYDSSSGAIYVNANGEGYGSGSSGGLLGLDSKPADLLATDFEVLPADSAAVICRAGLPCR